MTDSKESTTHPREDVEGKKLAGADILCECLVREGVEVVFGFPGGVVLPLYRVLPDYPISHILVRHEQGAAHAADGYARATGRPGVCLATSGPGATNLVTGIANAHLDSSPIVALTGQVATPFIGKDGFQEVDITGITLPITKHNFVVHRVEDLARTVRKAFHIATTGRPGPVLIDLPRDVLGNETVFEYPRTVNLPGYKPTLQGNTRQIRQAARLINESERPVILAGHGVIISEAYAELRDLAEKAEIPVASTLLGISSFPGSHPLSLGMLGMHGLAHVNKAITNSDLVIALGMRFDDRATGKTSTFAPHAKIVHVDIDPAEIGKNVRVHVPIVGDVKNVLRVLNLEVAPTTRTAWIKRVDDWREMHRSLDIPERDGAIERQPCQLVNCPHPCLSAGTRKDRVMPQYVVRQIHAVTGGDAIVVSDVGQNQMWSAQHFIYDHPNSFVSSGGLGTMGFGMPAAMGVKVGRPDKVVWAIVGDGGFQMTIQELATLVQDRIDIKIAIMNNGYLGMIRQWQELFFDRVYAGARLIGPDFVKLAEAYGVHGRRVAEKEDVEPAIRWAMEVNGPVVLDFVTEPDANVYPMVPPGGSICDFLEHRWR
ncbi:MAG: acetolactate synthase large subunit [Chloroflexi bacterium]|nr:acetolactate synthase large subunit [Chloroflexota bacterium]